MPLQIRRGTNAERQSMTVPLATGELLYTTDTQKIYVGNGTTVGGILTSGFNENDAKDSAAEMIVGGSHAGISFSYDDENKTLSATVDTVEVTGPVIADAFVGSVFADDSTLLVDGINGRIVGPVFADVTGDVFGDLKGSVFGDDSTLLINGVDNAINLNNTINTDIIPKETEEFDIGSNNRKFSRGYFSNEISTDDTVTSLRTVTRRIESPSTPIDAALVISNEATNGPVQIQGTSIIHLRSVGVTSRTLIGAVNDIDPASGLVDVVSTSVPTNPRYGFSYFHHHESSDVQNFNFIRTRGSVLNWDTVQENDTLGRILFWGAGTTDFTSESKLINPSAAITVTCSDTPDGISIPSELTLSTTDVGENVPVPKAKLSSNGTWKVNNLQSLTATTPLNLLSIPKLPTFADEAAADATVGGSPENGMMYYDSGANKIKIRENNVWVTITP